MFDFTHMRNCVEKLKKHTSNYAKNFWQYFFNSFEFQADYPLTAEHSFTQIPAEADPKDVITSFEFFIRCTESGNVEIIITKYIDTDKYHRMLFNELIDNGFIMQTFETSTGRLRFTNNIHFKDFVI